MAIAMNTVTQLLRMKIIPFLAVFCMVVVAAGFVFPVFNPHHAAEQQLVQIKSWSLGAMFFFSDARKLWVTASSLDARLVLIPMLLGVGSYALMALSYQGIAAAAGAEVPFWEMLKITFVANTVNYVVSTGGLSGFAVRLYFFIRCKIPSGTAVIISLVQTFITNTILLLFVVGGFAYLLSSHELHGYTLGTIATLLFFFVQPLLFS